MGYHLRDEVAAGPRAERCETGNVLTGFQSVGPGYRYYNAELGRWINRDPIGERGGVNVYAFLGNSSAKRIDFLGLASWKNKPVLPPKEIFENACCICEIEPDECYIDLRWYGQLTSVRRINLGDQMMDDVEFGASALLRLRHRKGKSVHGCHLRQDAGHVWTNISSPEILELHNIPDYSSTTTTAHRDVYGGTWLWDAPYLAMSEYAGGATAPYWNQFSAVVFVEEAPSVRIEWGYEGRVMNWMPPQQWMFRTWSK